MTKPHAHRESASGMSRYTYLNPDFMPNHVDERYWAKCRVSSLAGDLWAMISTIECAFDSTSGVPIENRGISTALEVAGNMAGDLIERCEFLERDLQEATKKSAVDS